MRTHASPLVLLVLAACANGGPDAGRPEASPEVARALATITPEDMIRRIGILADDSLRGRDTPSPERSDGCSSHLSW